MIGNGSYLKEDVTFLLKDLKDLNLELDNETREKLKSSGVHYSKMLPIESAPKEKYFKVYEDVMDRNAEDMARYIAELAHRIIRAKGENVVLVSLARAGTPVGVLLSRYMNNIMCLNIVHYSVSIIRGVGIDINALKYIANNHPESRIQFVDGWTGKGAITKTLKESCNHARDMLCIDIDDDLAVVADPGGCAEIYATREDWLLPNACFNSTISGLVSRTVYDDEFIGSDEFHGAKYYSEFSDIDESLNFVNRISDRFNIVDYDISDVSELDWRGIKFVDEVAKEFDIKDINLIKPSIGETTRVMLRRVPRLILVNDIRNKDLEHIIMLARESDVTIVERPGMPYACCGIIKEVDGDTNK